MYKQDCKGPSGAENLEYSEHQCHVSLLTYYIPKVIATWIEMLPFHVDGRSRSHTIVLAQKQL